MAIDATIEDLRADDEGAGRACAQILVDAFRGHTESWPDLESGLATVRELIEEGVSARIARDAEGAVLGWVGALEAYDGHAWEVHPLAIAPEYQRVGLGRRLLADLETLAAARGVTTLWLGTDDEDGRTSLGGLDPYPDPLDALARIRNLGGHPFEFYQRCGFVLVGMLPDANGPGKPDIFMAKRVGPR
ncbi:MAG: GNAT family N-acetyltransferase [Dehalococcoidia bacterium]